MNYQLKNKQVDAYQLEDFNVNGSLPPRWVISKILDGSIVVIASTRTLKFQSYIINIGDWIIKSVGGQLFVATNAEFLDQYELIP